MAETTRDGDSSAVEAELEAVLATVRRQQQELRSALVAIIDALAPAVTPRH